MKPALKPAVRQSTRNGGLQLSYRGQQLALQPTEASLFARLAPLLDGRHDAAALSRTADIDPSDLDWQLAQLEAAHLLVEGEGWSPQPDLYSAEQAFWVLEADVCRVKFGEADDRLRNDLEVRIARGEVAQTVAEGWLVELGYLLRQVPQELSLAVATAGDEATRAHYVEFFKEECDHGQMMYDKLKDWIAPERLLAMRPLPSTLAVLNMYRALASDGPLSYAVALMRDESTPLDPAPAPETDPYAGLRTHYQVPAPVVDIFEWHAHLDRDCEHGFFPLEIFRQQRWIDRRTVQALRQRLLSLFETHAMWRRELANYFATHSVHERVPA
ncbi:hypothetical protein [Roseateles sp. BYS96W]|uniref:Iron-containing redox enzyme family protein n=1 Tax=Pelomonas nitida TaxID=3299027 RepID=A0ABW7GCQ1_9BURK